MTQNILTGAVFQRLFTESAEPLSAMQTEEEVAAWWKHYAGRVRNVFDHASSNKPIEAPMVPGNENFHSPVEADPMLAIAAALTQASQIERPLHNGMFISLNGILKFTV